MVPGNDQLELRVNFAESIQSFVVLGHASYHGEIATVNEYIRSRQWLSERSVRRLIFFREKRRTVGI